MPGADERQPSPADRPPASRVADELAEEERRRGDDLTDEEMAEAEQAAVDRAREKGWDNPLEPT